MRFRWSIARGGGPTTSAVAVQCVACNSAMGLAFSRGQPDARRLAVRALAEGARRHRCRPSAEAGA